VDFHQGHLFGTRFASNSQLYLGKDIQTPSPGETQFTQPLSCRHKSGQPRRSCRVFLSEGTLVCIAGPIPVLSDIHPAPELTMRKIVALLTLASLVAGCGRPASDPEPAASEPVAVAATADEAEISVYAAAVASETRPEADRASDAGRKPEAVLEFFGIQPGDVVLEMWAGGGYYTELLAHVVGENGKVVAHANTPILNFAGEEYTNRHADNRLPNTEVLLAENNELALEADSYDAATIILNYHDLYWSSEEYGWEQIDVPAFLAELYKGIKPGGTLGIVDHQAVGGSPAETGGTLHRIDSAIVIAELESAGFVFDGQRNVLASSEDDHTKNVFDPAVRGKTDRYVLRFRKPE
jgi:predicted methyltransferase